MSVRAKTLGLICAAGAVAVAGVVTSMPADAEAPDVKIVKESITTTEANQPAEATVRCPAGYHLTGGGGGTGGDKTQYLWKSRPTDDGKGWTAASYSPLSNEKPPNDGGGMSAPYTVTVYAVCASDT